MKTVTAIATIILLFFSCTSSDELTSSKAERIIKECIKKEPMYGSVKTVLGKNIPLGYKEKEQAKRLAENGLVKFSKTTYYQNVELTDKGKSLLLDKEETMSTYSSGKPTKVSFKTCDYKLLEVIEIKEVPALNKALVKMKFEKINKTEISELQKNKSDFSSITLKFSKTSNGWKLCD